MSSEFRGARSTDIDSAVPSGGSARPTISIHSVLICSQPARSPLPRASVYVAHPSRSIQLSAFGFSAFTSLPMEVRSIEAIVRALNEAEVQYLIVGGLAVNAHGYERLTVDIDMVIGLNPRISSADFARLLADWLPTVRSGHSGAIRRSKLRDEWRREKGMIVLKLWSDSHRRTPLDIFIYEPFDFAAGIRTGLISAGGR